MVDDENVDIAESQHQNNPEEVTGEPYRSSQDKTQNVCCSSQEMKKKKKKKK